MGGFQNIEDRGVPPTPSPTSAVSGVRLSVFKDVRSKLALHLACACSHPQPLGKRRPRWSSRTVCALSGRTTHRSRSRCVASGSARQRRCSGSARTPPGVRGCVAQAGTLRPPFQSLAEARTPGSTPGCGPGTRSAVWCHTGAAQFVLLDPERGLGLGQLHVGLPEVLGRPVRDILRSAALATLRRLQGRRSPRPGHDDPPDPSRPTWTEKSRAARVFLPSSRPIRRSITPRSQRLCARAIGCKPR